MSDQKKILIIDDEEPVRNVLKKILEKNGYQVAALSNSTDGLSLLQTDTIDLIITDLIMPDPDGFETMKEIKVRKPGAKIIAISGHFEQDPESYRKTLKTYGADAVLKKPVDKDEIIQKVAELID